MPGARAVHRHHLLWADPSRLVAKVADAQEVSFDYLIGKTKMEVDKDFQRLCSGPSSLAHQTPRKLEPATSFFKKT